MTSCVAELGLTTILVDVAELTPPKLVVKLRLMVSALLYERPRKLRPPPACPTRRSSDLKLAVPSGPRATVTVCVLSLVTMLPKVSSSATTGWGENNTPAVAAAG